MLAVESDYGPFAPVVGYGGEIIAAGGALFFMWGGKMQKWRPPDEDLPGTAQAIVLLLCGVGMVLQWYFATPGALAWLLGATAVLAIGCVMCFLRYSGMLGTYIYVKKKATGENSTRDVRVLGGRKLLTEAEKKRVKLGVDIQGLLEGAAYRTDLLWSREDRQRVKQSFSFLHSYDRVWNIRIDGSKLRYSGASDQESGSECDSHERGSGAKIVGRRPPSALGFWSPWRKSTAFCA